MKRENILLKDTAVEKRVSSSAVILGVDPGLRATGFGLVACQDDRLRYVASGVIRARTALDLAERLKVIFEGLVEIIEHYHPTEACIEQVFVNVNPASTLLLGQARGVALCAVATCALQAVEYTALQIKQAVVGQGHAEKTQVQDMVKRLLSLKKSPSADAADALACAICHAFCRTYPVSSSRKGRKVRGGRLL